MWHAALPLLTPSYQATALQGSSNALKQLRKLINKKTLENKQMAVLLMDKLVLNPKMMVGGGGCWCTPAQSISHCGCAAGWAHAWMTTSRSGALLMLLPASLTA
jgi:hypothetical protein